MTLPETLNELSADPAKAIAVLRSLAGDAPTAGETPAAAAAAFASAGTSIQSYVEGARAKIAAQLMNSGSNAGGVSAA